MPPVVETENSSENEIEDVMETRKYFESNSAWTNIKKGPLGIALYACGTYWRVIFNHMLFHTKLHESWTIWQETSIRTIKWSFDTPFARLRKNSDLFGYLLRNSCSEPVTKLRNVTGVKGYWVGRETWKGDGPEAVVLYIHGGGYIAGSPSYGFPSLSYILKTLRKKYQKHIRILAINYPLSPESQHPEAVNAAERAYRWLAKKCRAEGCYNVMICGDSAGGSIVLGLLQRLYEQNNINNNNDNNNNRHSTLKIHPSGVVLVSPWVELISKSITYFTNAKYDYIPGHFVPLAAEYYLFGSKPDQKKGWKRNPRQEKSMDTKTKVTQWLQDIETFSWSNVVEDAESTGNTSSPTLLSYDIHDIKGKKEKRSKNMYQDPEASPIHTPLELLGLYPPMLVTYGGKELFKDDIEFFIQRCLEAKLMLNGDFSENMDWNLNRRQFHSMDAQHPDIEVETDKEMVHNYPWLPQFFKQHSRHALNRIAKFIARNINQPLMPGMISKTTSLPQPSQPSTISNSTFINRRSGVPHEDETARISRISHRRSFLHSE